MKVAERMNYIPFSGIREVFEEVKRREKKGERIIHLEIGRPDFDTPAHIKEAAKSALNEGKVHYSSNYGLPELREAIARKLQLDNNLFYDPASEIIVTVGITEGILISMMALLNPGDEILIPSPSFPCYSSCARMAGAVPIAVPLKEEKEFNPDIHDFLSRITQKTRMIVINTPNNPTGAVFRAEVLEGLAQLAQEKDLFILSDEIYEKMVYDGNRHFSIASIPGMKERTITLNGFSKSYSMTGWRLGYAAASSEVVSGLVRIHQYSTVCATSFAQWGAIQALNGPQDSVKAMVQEFDRRRVMIMKRLLEMPGIWFVRPKGAFYVFLNIRGLHKTPQELTDYLLDKAKVAVVPWETDHIRLSYANSYENLEEAMYNMKEGLKGL